MTTRSKVWCLFLAAILIAPLGCGNGGSSPSPNITAAVPNAQGMSIVSGKPGSVTGSSEVIVSSTDPPTPAWPDVNDCSEGSVQIAPDGSFSVTVCDHPGETLYVFDSADVTTAGVEVVVATVEVR